MCKRILFVQENFFIKNFINKKMFIGAFVLLVNVSLPVFSMNVAKEGEKPESCVTFANGPAFSPEIFDAIKKDDFKTVENIVLGIKSGVKFNFNTLNADGENVLYFACAENKTNIAEFLIKNGARGLINIYQDENFWTPLSWAAYWGNLDLVELLLKYGSEPVVNFFDKEYNATPIYWPIVKQNTKIVELLIKNGAKIEGDCFYEVSYGEDGGSF
jgi:FOG: Ankyrin repeat